MNRKCRNYFVLAFEAYEKEDFQLAVDFFKKAYVFAEEEDSKINILINIAEIYEEMDKNELAISIYKKIISNLGEIEEAYYGIGMIQEKLLNYKEAIINYKKAIFIDESYRDASFFLANLYDEAYGDKENAIFWYKHTISHNEYDFMANNNLGCIYEEMGDLELAEKYFIKSIEINDSYFRSHFNYGVVLKKLGRFDGAIIEYEIARDLKPEYSDVYLNLSALYIEQNNYMDSISILTQGLTVADNKTNLFYNRACSYLHIGNEEQAFNDLKNSVRLNKKIVDFARTDEDFIEYHDDKRFIDALKIDFL